MVKIIAERFGGARVGAEQPSVGGARFIIHCLPCPVTVVRPDPTRQVVVRTVTRFHVQYLPTGKGKLLQFSRTRRKMRPVRLVGKLVKAAVIASQNSGHIVAGEGQFFIQRLDRREIAADQDCRKCYGKQTYEKGYHGGKAACGSPCVIGDAVICPDSTHLCAYALPVIRLARVLYRLPGFAPGKIIIQLLVNRPDLPRAPPGAAFRAELALPDVRLR